MSEHPVTKVQEVMNEQVRIVDGMMTVRDAIEILSKSRISSLIVDRRDENDEYGIVVVSDIAREVIAAGRSPDRVNVYEIMTKPIVTLPPRMNIKHAASLLVRYHLTRGLVVDLDGAPCGIVTLRDIVIRFAGFDLA